MFRLALKNLMRYKKRTFITAFAVAFGVAMGIFVTGLLTGIDNDSDRNMIWFETSSAKFIDSRWFKEKNFYPIDYLISSDKAKLIEDKLKENNISNYTKEFVETADVIFYQNPYPATGSVKAIIHGIDGNNAYKFDKSEIQGDWIDKNGDGVVIGAKLAEDINAELGYYLTIQCKGKGGFIQAFDIPITGIINTGNPAIDQNSLFFNYEYLNDMLALDNSYSAIAVLFNDPLSDKYEQSSMKVLTDISQQADTGVYLWKQIEYDLFQLKQSKSSISLLIIFFLFIIALVGVTNTMIMAITERKNEIAMLRTLGYKNSFIKLLFTIEGGFIGVIGALIGLFFGAILTLYYQINGIDFSTMLKQDMEIGYRINMVMYATLDYNKIILICIMSVVFCLLAAFVAVRKSTVGEIAEEFRRI